MSLMHTGFPETEAQGLFSHQLMLLGGEGGEREKGKENGGICIGKFYL